MNVRRLSPSLRQALMGVVVFTLFEIFAASSSLAQTIAPATTPPTTLPARGAASAATQSTTRGGGGVIARIDASYVPTDAQAVIAFRPAQIMSSPTTAMLPVEVASAAGIKHLGFDPAKVDEVVAYVKLSPESPLPEYGILLKFNQPLRGADISPSIRAHTQPGQVAGRQYLQSSDPILPSYFAPDNRTLLIAPDATLKELVAKKEPTPPGPLLQKVRLVRGHHDIYAAVDVASFRPQIQPAVGRAQMLAQGQLPPESSKLFEAPNLIASAELTINLSNPGPTSLVVHANDPPAAQQLDQIFADGLKMYQDAMTARATQLTAAGDDPIAKAQAAYSLRSSARLTKNLRPVRNGTSFAIFRIEGGSMQQQAMLMAVDGLLPLLMSIDAQQVMEFASSVGPGPPGQLRPTGLIPETSDGMQVEISREVPTMNREQPAEDASLNREGNGMDRGRGGDSENRGRAGERSVDESSMNRDGADRGRGEERPREEPRGRDSERGR